MLGCTFVHPLAPSVRSPTRLPDRPTDRLARSPARPSAGARARVNGIRDQARRDHRLMFKWTHRPSSPKCRGMTRYARSTARKVRIVYQLGATLFPAPANLSARCCRDSFPCTCYGTRVSLLTLPLLLTSSLVTPPFPYLASNFSRVSVSLFSPFCSSFALSTFLTLPRRSRVYYYGQFREFFLFLYDVTCPLTLCTP